MKIVLFSALAAAILVMAGPAGAYTGMEFSQRCGNGPPAAYLDNGFCEGFLLGFYDSLAASGEMCPRKPPTDWQLARVVQSWLRFHANHAVNPTGYMIRNALVRAWGCH
jgi:Rap1a immunity proteins